MNASRIESSVMALRRCASSILNSLAGHLLTCESLINLGTPSKTLNHLQYDCGEIDVYVWQGTKSSYFAAEPEKF